MRPLLLISALFLIFGAAPALAQGDPYDTNLERTGLVPCTGADSATGASSTGWNCRKEEFFELLQNIMYFCAFYLAVPLSTIVICYAGIKMLTNASNPGALKEAKGMMVKVVIGLFWVLGAYLVVSTALKLVLNETLSSNIDQGINISN